MSSPTLACLLIGSFLCCLNSGSYSCCEFMIAMADLKFFSLHSGCCILSTPSALMGCYKCLARAEHLHELIFTQVLPESPPLPYKHVRQSGLQPRPFLGFSDIKERQTPFLFLYCLHSYYSTCHFQVSKNAWGLSHHQLAKINSIAEFNSIMSILACG